MLLIFGGTVFATESLFAQTAPCSGDAVRGELPGIVGWVCAPPCNPDNTCPSNTELGATAIPVCFLQEELHAGVPKFFCGLSCKADSECPPKATCATVSADTTSVPGDHRVCTHPMNVADWQTNSQNSHPVRFIIANPPAKAAENAPARAVASLQAMRIKYGIPEADVDYLVVYTALIGEAALVGAALSQEPRGKGVLGSIGGDLRYGKERFSEGFGGVNKFYRDAVRDITHIETHNAATDLLHGLFWFFVLYLAIGSCLKYNVQGARGIQMIPHIEFWRETPLLVVDGIKYTKVLIGQIGASKGSTEYAPPGERNPDSFSTFVPA